MGKGKRYENEITNALDRATGGHVNVYPVGYSGSHATSAEDVLITDASTGINYALEVKTASTDYCYVEPDELEALVARGNGGTVAALVINFSNREVAVVRYFDELTQKQVSNAEDYNELPVEEKFAILAPNCMNPRVTDSGKLALTKPPLDEWESAQAGLDDTDAILSGLGIKTEQSTQVL